MNPTIKAIQKQHFEFTKATMMAQTLVSRHLTDSEVALDSHDRDVPLAKEAVVTPAALPCYPCMTNVRRAHPVYIFSCQKCGNTFQQLRHLQRNLEGHVALVTGGRIKLGHQIVLKLLRAGCTVIATTRATKKAEASFAKYEDYTAWSDRLVIYPGLLDFDTPMMATPIAQLAHFVETTFGRLDILINSAAQTIRCREKDKQPLQEGDATNRYCEPKFVDESRVNSWQMELADLRQPEMEEVYRVNAIAPCLMVQQLLPLMQKSRVTPYIINVNSREGLFDVGQKTGKHIHLNMAKSGLAKLHRTLVDANLQTDAGVKFKIHACDPGWISIDEYYASDKPWPVPPLDEIDGAARILYPLWTELKSQPRTRRHFHRLCY